ncbi:glucose-1-phosphate thymidylyltransferase [Bacilli bacterium PM5-3]|nr:glucose-1-phosphate thymidylyltransferase [Bacilli bacterium PM5-3]
MKGIILAGGSGTRLYPLTKGLSKQMIPIFDKPMIYYPLSTLMLAKIKDILIITTREDQENFKRLLGDGSFIGLNIEWAIQDEPNGLAEAFIIGEDFIGDDEVCLVLGDNFFYGQHFVRELEEIRNTLDGCTVCGIYVKDPTQYGVLSFDGDKVVEIEEKPEKPKSNYAVPGLYFYDNSVIEKAKNVKPSARGELEITTLNNMYLKENKMNARLMGRGMTWLDTGTHIDLIQAANFVETIQNRQGLYIGAIEEISYRNKWIDDEQFLKICDELKKTDYGEYLTKIYNENRGEKK